MPIVTSSRSPRTRHRRHPLISFIADSAAAATAHHRPRGAQQDRPGLPADAQRARTSCTAAHPGEGRSATSTRAAAVDGHHEVTARSRRATSRHRDLAQFFGLGGGGQPSGPTRPGDRRRPGMTAFGATGWCSRRWCSVAAVLLPVLLIMRRWCSVASSRPMQDALRTSVGDGATLSEISETAGGIRVTWSLRRRPRRPPTPSCTTASGQRGRQYRAQVRARFFFAISVPRSTCAGSALVGGRPVASAWWDRGSRPTLAGDRVPDQPDRAQPVAELPPVRKSTRPNGSRWPGLLGWRKVPGPRRAGRRVARSHRPLRPR